MQKHDAKTASVARLRQADKQCATRVICSGPGSSITRIRRSKSIMIREAPLRSLAFALRSRARGICTTPSPTPTPDKSQYTLFNPTPVDLRRAYNTDRPSKTDSPFTIDAGVFQIESDVCELDADDDAKHGDVRIRTWIVGNTNFKLGLTNWMDLQVFPAILCQHAARADQRFGEPVEQDGFGDTTVRLKINLLGNDGGKLVIGFLSSLKIPDQHGRYRKPCLGTRL